MKRLVLLVAVIGSAVLASRFLIAGGGSGAFANATLTVTTITSPSEGGWVWFGARRAVGHGSETITGYITGNSGGDVKAVQIDNATRAVTATTTLYDNFQLDDHDPPSFVVRPDGVIMAAFAYHVGELYVGIGTSPGVLPAQAQVTNITSQVGSLTGGAGYTYASIFYLDDEDRYYIFCRYHNASGVPYFVYTYSDDDGATWAARTAVQQITYHQVAKNGTGRFDFVVSDHPLYGQGDNAAIHTSIYHMYYQSGSGWHKSDGTGLTPTIGNTAATLVYDGTTSRAWLWDIAINGSGHPVIVYVVYEETFPSGAWHYEYATWSGSAWSTHLVADAGGAIAPGATPEHGNNYAGGIVIDRTDTTVVYYSSNAGGTFQVYRAITPDGGTSWVTTALTSDSDKNVRPVAVVDPSSTLRVLWLYGTYTDYFTYAQGIKGAGLP
jgi:hypothetical protein